MYRDEMWRKSACCGNSNVGARVKPKYTIARGRNIQSDIHNTETNAQPYGYIHYVLHVYCACTNTQQAQ